MIALFEKIRDIPYTIEKTLLDPRKDPTGILRLNRGSCSPKHYLLGTMYEDLGLKVKYLSYKFTWDDHRFLKIFPPDLALLAKDFPILDHFNIELLINNKWTLIDASFNPELKQLGFSINENWDGLKGQDNAFTALDRKEHPTAWDCASYMQQERDKTSPEQKTKASKFVERFNAWIKAGC